MQFSAYKQRFEIDYIFTALHTVLSLQTTFWNRLHLYCFTYRKSHFPYKVTKGFTVHWVMEQKHSTRTNQNSSEERHSSTSWRRFGFSRAAATLSLSFNCLLTVETKKIQSIWTTCKEDIYISIDFSSSKLLINYDPLGIIKFKLSASFTWFFICMRARGYLDVNLWNNDHINQIKKSQGPM